MKTQKIILKIIEWILAFIVALIIVTFISIFISQGKVSGSSMMPTYEDGTRVFIQKQFYDIKKGDVITFWSEKKDEKPNLYDKITYFEKIFYDKEFLENKELHIKRVVGIPGDEIEVKNEYENSIIESCVYVNSIKEICSSEEKVKEQVYSLGKDQFYVIGDNYNNSYDSRLHGPINKKDIYGKIIFSREDKNEK